MRDSDPIADPLKLRDTMAEARFNSAKRLGLDPNYAEVRAEAEMDLAFVDRVQQEGDLDAGPTTKSESRTRPRSADPVGDMASQAGAKFQRREIETEARLPDLVDVNERISQLVKWLPPAQRKPGRNLLMVMDPRLVMKQTPYGFAMSLRYQQLLSRTPHDRGAEKMKASFLYPKFAHALLSEYGWKLAGARHYKDMTVGQAEQEFLARVRGICDRSTGVLGAWWQA